MTDTTMLTSDAVDDANKSNQPLTSRCLYLVMVSCGGNWHCCL